MDTYIKEFNGEKYIVTDCVKEINNSEKGDLMFFNKDYFPMYHSDISKANHLFTVQFCHPRQSIAFEEMDGVLDLFFRSKEMYKVVRKIQHVD